jgi:wyosine [tRNA(Phe)-imidazoG37] synthetase (radical SAM superfamily)
LLRARGEQVDYLSFVPDGEPTLDVKRVHSGKYSKAIC